MWGYDLKELFLKGGWVMWPLLGCSALGLAIILERAFVLLWRSVSFPRLERNLRQFLEEGKTEEAIRKFERSRSPVANVAAMYLRHRDDEPALREEVCGRLSSEMVVRLETRLGVLGMIVQVAPLLGLLGTVVGLVDAFHEIEIKSGQVQPGDLASGIWTALLTTVFGLVIAVPCQIAHYLLDRRIGLLILQMEWIVGHLNEWQARKKPGGGA